MALPGCKMMVFVEPPTAFIKIAGRAAAEGARDFQQLVRRLHSEGIPRFCLDLTACLLMDSTFSGVLAGLVHEFGPGPDDNCKRFTVVGANARVLDLLDNLGVLPLTNSLAQDVIGDAKSNGTEIVIGQHSRTELTTCCLEAHQMLMTLKPENTAKFRTVTEVLEQQLSAAA